MILTGTDVSCNWYVHRTVPYSLSLYSRQSCKRAIQCESYLKLVSSYCTSLLRCDFYILIDILDENESINPR